MFLKFFLTSSLLLISSSAFSNRYCWDDRDCTSYQYCENFPTIDKNGICYSKYSNKNFQGEAEGSSINKFAIEEAESQMYKKAFKYCEGRLPIRIEAIKHVDVGYLATASSRFKCKK